MTLKSILDTYEQILNGGFCDTGKIEQSAELVYNILTHIEDFVNKNHSFCDGFYINNNENINRCITATMTNIIDELECFVCGGEDD